MSRAWISVAIAAASIACIKAPEIVTVDRATALEQQAGASFPALEKKLAREAVTPRAVPLTPEQVDSIGLPSSPVVDEHEVTDAERVDDWLERHCVGEGNDGLLVDTSSACRGAADHEEVVKLVDRANRSRAQLWRWMHEQQPNVAVEELRKQWRVKHAAGVTCGAWMQDDAGNWREKTC